MIARAGDRAGAAHRIGLCLPAASATRPPRPRHSHHQPDRPMITTAENDARPPGWTPCIGLAGYSKTDRRNAKQQHQAAAVHKRP
jgi:hypothetical protein